MYSIVKRLRKNGSRLPEREIASDQGAVGHLSLAILGHTLILRLYAPGGVGARHSLVPELYNARVILMEGDKQLWEGEERESADWRGRAIKQEWSVRLAVDPPPDVPPPTRRLG